MPILGTVKLQLQIAGGTYRCDFHVVQNLTYEAVLGLDFLRANGPVIDLKNATLKLEDSPAEPHPDDTCHV